MKNEIKLHRYYELFETSEQALHKKNFLLQVWTQIVKKF